MGVYVRGRRGQHHVKISEQQASQIATGLYPGTIKEVEYEIEANSDSTYEPDVVDEQGTEWKVEVDVSSGDIIEAYVEQWQIRYDASEVAKASI
jgi:uncharacterized membrane protein YkoI